MSGKYNRFFDLTGKSAIVTGGVGILGRHFCRGLAESGANVTVVDLDRDAVSRFAEELTQHSGNKCIGIACDITKDDQVLAMRDQVIATFDKIDVLHNNAATKSDNPRNFFNSNESFDMEDWRKIMSVNVDALFLVARAVGSHMAARRSGSIIQTGSIYGIVAPDQRIYEGSNYMGGPINTPAVYSASKASVVGLTKYFASYWGKDNVRVNTLVPGGVRSGQNEVFIQKYSARVPMGRMAEPEEMVGTLIFLASDASTYITGQTLAIDGGLTAW